jgi:polysaccharide biosynthesis protein PslH
MELAREMVDRRQRCGAGMQAVSGDATEFDSVFPITAGNRRPQVLCVMRMPPNLDGLGGSQRAWRLLEALLPHGDVHFVLVYRSQDDDCMSTSLAPIEPLVASVTRINIAGWQGTSKRLLGIVPLKLCDFLKMGSHEAPRLSRKQLRTIAERLPLRDPDVIFAGRVCTATIVQALIDGGWLRSRLKVVDFDDLMSKFRLRQMHTEGAEMTPGRRLAARLDAHLIARAEQRLARSWDALSVCTSEDVAALRAADQGATVTKVPNVVSRERLPPPASSKCFRVLFVGNLSFSANTDGLALFVDEAWPIVRRALPNAELSIVGMHPSVMVRELAARNGFALQADVPSLKPFYEQCDVVIAPILFGSGTRIKILEAMAYGRPVVSTTVGAEGMGLEDGRHLLLGDAMADFAAALVRLAIDPALGRRLADEAWRFQQNNFMPVAVDRAVAELLRLGVERAARAGRTSVGGEAAEPVTWW